MEGSGQLVEQRRDWFSLLRPTVEIPLFSFILFYAFNLMAMQSFLTYSLCLERFASNFTNQSDIEYPNSTSPNPPNPANTSNLPLQQFCKWNITNDKTYEWDMRNLSALTSDWVFYNNLCMYVPAFFSAAMLGAWGDLYSRKLAVIVPAAGNAIGMLMCYFFAQIAPERLHPVVFFRASVILLIFY